MTSDKPLTGYAQLWGAIIRPPRQHYDVSDLGPSSFTLRGREYHRTDLTILNPHGQVLHCSHFEPEESTRVADMLPCVIYLHGNCSSRLETLDILEVLLPMHITVFAFDFAGSGMSDGEYISLGWYEREDLGMVIEHLRYSGRTNHIGLWGRSMGAVTALLYAPTDPELAGIVLDSAFSSLPELAQELAGSHSSVPAFLISAGMSLVRNSIKKKIGLDINELKPIHYAPQSLVPALFIAADMDTLVKPYHTRLLYSAYAGRKKLVTVAGEHNGERPQSAIDQVQKFFCHVLRCHSLPSARTPTNSGLSFHLSRASTQGSSGLSDGFAKLAREADVNELLAAMLQEIKDLKETSDSVDLLGLGNGNPPPPPVQPTNPTPPNCTNLLDL